MDCTKKQKNIHFYSRLYVVELGDGIVDEANDGIEVLQFGRELLLVVKRSCGSISTMDETSSELPGQIVSSLNNNFPFSYT